MTVSETCRRLELIASCQGVAYDTPRALGFSESIMSWNIDKSRSNLEFAVKHMVISTVRGVFSDYDAEILLDDSQLEQASVVARVRTASVSTKDATRDEYLVSPEFFDPQTFPEMLFRSTGVRVRGKRITLIGDLTIRDCTRSITLSGNWNSQGGGMNCRLQFSFSGEIEREAFGLVFNSAVETVSVVVGKKIKLNVEILLVES
ncbi:MAG: YceI family protein [Polyangiaceae bacterium]|nr:YceI family protein [Polyangiaceae bacterium]